MKTWLLIKNLKIERVIITNHTIHCLPASATRPSTNSFQTLPPVQGNIKAFPHRLAGKHSFLHPLVVIPPRKQLFRGNRDNWTLQSDQDCHWPIQAEEPRNRSHGPSRQHPKRGPPRPTTVQDDHTPTWRYSTRDKTRNILKTTSEIRVPPGSEGLAKK